MSQFDTFTPLESTAISRPFNGVYFILKNILKFSTFKEVRFGKNKTYQVRST